MPTKLKGADPGAEPWLMYRSMGLEDLKLALNRVELRNERLRNELASTRKLVETGAAARVELVELAGQIDIGTAERDELAGLIVWVSYLNELSRMGRAFDEAEYFGKFLGHLEPRMRLAERTTALEQRRHQMNLKLRERRAISADELERSADAVDEAKASENYYRSQALSARYAFEVRQGKREYREEESQALAQVEHLARVKVWERARQTIEHRQARLKVLKERGIASQVEIDGAEESRRVIEKALEEARESQPEPYPAPGRMKRPTTQLVQNA